MEGSKHSNRLQLLGHLYQLDVALYDLLYNNEPETVVRIEYYGDFNIGTDGKFVSTEVKEHFKKGNLTDNSEDLWKTIDCWIAAYRNNGANQFRLITTHSLPENKIAYLLSPQGYDPVEAVKRLDSVSKGDNKRYECYKSLSEIEKRDLFSKARIYGDNPSPPDMIKEIKPLLGQYPPDLLDEILSVVDSWWSRMVIRTLSDESSYIKRSELNSVISRFLQGKIEKTLPVLKEQPFDEAVKDRIFWKQLELIGVSQTRMSSCAVNLLTTESSISKWMSDFLITDKEMDEYKDRIKKSWGVKYHRTLDHLGDHPDEGAKRAAGKGLLDEMEKDPRYIRSLQDDMIYNGFCHIMSDEMKIGWHPEFDSLLERER
jgi:hypothetical protein